MTALEVGVVSSEIEEVYDELVLHLLAKASCRSLVFLSYRRTLEAIEAASSELDLADTDPCFCFSSC